jgi:hypothetical protein
LRVRGAWPRACATMGGVPEAWRIDLWRGVGCVRSAKAVWGWIPG